MLFSAGTSHTKVTLQLIPCGLDWQAILCGGDRPHIGAVVLAVPRPSLKDALVLSCDCWVNPVTAHKDHLVAQPLAETLCIACGHTVSVSAGLHIDHISPDELRQLRKHCAQVTAEAESYLKKQPASQPR